MSGYHKDELDYMNPVPGIEIPETIFEDEVVEDPKDDDTDPKEDDSNDEDPKDDDTDPKEDDSNDEDPIVEN